MILGISEKVGAQVVASDTAAGGALDVWNVLKRNAFTGLVEPIRNVLLIDADKTRQLCLASGDANGF